MPGVHAREQLRPQGLRGVGVSLGPAAPRAAADVNDCVAWSAWMLMVGIGA
ncbi:hypothetical protein [Streptomyces sp. V3I7]|uniref:hypothetical protein n=1 Tax=Streptomyces sp. V3I7 TaxID=3042278 RepID=UPI002784E6AA|nr:hypothetical protein [Streptomyces sp. V3I7]MDQ0992441.1 hypothetical protein [Streptomyces sp. V3I7]